MSERARRTDAAPPEPAPDAAAPRPPSRAPAPAALGAGALAAALLLASAPAAPAQANLQHPPSVIERHLESEPFSVDTLRGARYPGDPTKQAVLAFEGGPRMLVKWAPAPPGGEQFNAMPRYEEAIYRLQQLFLEEGEYVVPPTACRCVPVWVYGELEERARPTFEGTSCVLVTLQSWLWSVTDEGVFDRDRFRRDTAYAHHLANLDVLTHLADHKDANEGNFLVSTVSDRPRVFAVDNGVSFGSRKSNRGDVWRELRVDRIPRETARRLREIDREDLARQLATVAQFEEAGSRGMTRVEEPGEPLDPGKGIRRADGVLQLGLTEGEIEGVWERLRGLVRRLEQGEITTF